MRAVLNRSVFVSAFVAVAALTPFEPSPVAASVDTALKLDAALTARTHVTGSSRVIVRATPGAPAAAVARLLQLADGSLGRRLTGISSQVAVLPNVALRGLAASPLIERISLDRRIVGATERTGHTVGAASVRQDLAYDGSGVTVAIIDSGVAAWHDDLTDAGVGQRVVRFVDLIGDVTGNAALPTDDYGHGTHVAGIIAGNGLASDGARTGMAPGARLVVLKVLDAAGRGYISDVIAALDYVVANRAALNIGVINLSVAAGVYESYTTDPLTLAAERAVRAGIVVVTAAGNNGRHAANGRTQYGGVTAPGNAPWVLTVGASSHMGTADRGDDTITPFTSRGPTAIDYRAKPDIVAPGVGIESLATPDSTLYSSASRYLLAGTRPTSYLPYLSLSGTSMSAPVVSGIVALMLQANPSLTPNEVKAILQYTAQVYPAYDPLTEGAGFVNARGAVDLARHLADPSTNPYPDASTWGAGLIWGNRLVRGGRLTAGANAWSTYMTWGAATTPDGHNVSWGVRCDDQDCTQTSGPWRVSNSAVLNVVWGSVCSGSDCTGTWTIDRVNSTTDGGETVVWGTDNGETVVWGTDGGETVVWGTDGGETVVWGTDGGETVVWGTSCADSSCVPIIWSQR